MPSGMVLTSKHQHEKFVFVLSSVKLILCALTL